MIPLKDNPAGGIWHGAFAVGPPPTVVATQSWIIIIIIATTDGQEQRVNSVTTTAAAIHHALDAVTSRRNAFSFRPSVDPTFYPSNVRGFGAAQGFSLRNRLFEFSFAPHIRRADYYWNPLKK